ncbi:MAG: sulfotransferase [Myxococcales bacterium]|nr:sulfotransferase [Myxococcales bacterium]
MRHRLVPFNFDSVRSAARRITGLDDFGPDDGFEDRLRATMQSLSTIDFNLIGRLAVRTAIHWHLSTRLNMVELMKQRPTIFDVPVEAPIFIVGLFRTGTTFLHHVMAADEESRAGLMWELSYPVGRKKNLMADFGWRKRRTSIPLTLNHLMVPDQDVVHYVSRDDYEEDFFLLGTDMAVMTSIVGLGDFEYGWSLLDWDLEVPYQWHKRQLQALWGQRSATRWLLKCPWHLWNLDSLLKVYPDARILHIHRDPAKALGSQCSLVGRMNCRLQRNLDVHELGKFWLDYSHAGMERGLKAKAALPASQVFDLRLKDLRSSPREWMNRVYDHFDLPFTPSLGERFATAAANEPAAQFGSHTYSIQDYGLTDELVREKFSSYCAQFGV